MAMFAAWTYSEKDGKMANLKERDGGLEEVRERGCKLLQDELDFRPKRFRSLLIAISVWCERMKNIR